ncbi:energy transducer TonB [Vreelandella rituensis]|uniref:Protein TonB n=1 Tax=Vreelandella rituensis TaxID=2282306 RepID=A0A368TYK2_9GAMM|nr:energy transducer TonB [Halomonas rituensis]RCV89307.1 energy transducer TonB [Halomonas rituensis]
MTRVLFSLLGGAGLALVLFWLLALLVSPPEKPLEEPEVPMSMTMVEAPEAVEEVTQETAEPVAQPQTLQETAPPSPAPEPLPEIDSSITMPEPELPPEEMVLAELDSSLPELSEIEPQPEPAPEPRLEPQPEPEPVPRPEPEPTPKPAPAAQSQPVEASTSPIAASNEAESTWIAQTASQEPVEVGSPTPLNQVPPEYPSRAQRRGLEGHVELEFLIRRDGSVEPSSIKVVGAQPRKVFDQAARKAVASWQFEVASQVRRARQRVEFQLR